MRHKNIQSHAQLEKACHGMAMDVLRRNNAHVPAMIKNEDEKSIYNHFIEMRDEHRRKAILCELNFIRM